MSHNQTTRKNYAKWAVDLAVHEAFASTRRNRAVQTALSQLLTTVQSRSLLLRPMPTGGHRSWEQPAHFVRGSLALAGHHRAWIREPQDWNPPALAARDVFGSLALHLLATHHVPTFMMSVWFLEDSPQTRQQQRWFKHIARGNNIRGADVPVRLNKKMAYCFSLAPDHYSVDSALGWGEACRMPETKRRKTSLTTRRRLKRRSNRQCSLGRWRPVPISGFRFVEPAKHQWSHHAWTIQQIVDEAALIAEGDAMRHCVASYADRCADGTTSIWSLKSQGSLTQHRVLTIEVNPETCTIIQARGERNTPPSVETLRIMSMWAERERLAIATSL